MRRSPLAPSVLTLLLPLALGCAGADAGSGEEEAPLFRGVEELRVGSLDDPDYALTQITNMTVGPDGSMYTAHMQESVVRKFSPDGTLEATLGQQGEGPGEFQRVWQLGFHGDSLWVLDLSANRFSFFRDGSFSSSFTVPVRFAPGVFTSRPTALLTDGSVLGFVGVPSRMVVSGEVTEQVITRMNPDGEVTDTIMRWPFGNSSWGINFGNRGGIYGRQPWADGSMGYVAHDGTRYLLERFVHVPGEDSPSFRLTRWTAAGDTLFDRSYRYEPTPLPRTAIDSVLDGRAESWSEMRDGVSYEEMRGLLAEALFAPEFLPPVESLFLGRDGTVWLRPHSLGDAETVRWWMLGPNGDVEAFVDLPVDLRFLAGDRRTVWGSVTDEFDVPYLVRYGLEAADATE